MFVVVKVLISAVIIGLVTALANRFPAYGGMIAALPLVSLLSIIWLYVEGTALNSLGQFTIGIVKGLPATIVMMLIIGVSLNYSLHLVLSLLLGIGGWVLFLVVQQMLLSTFDL